MSKCPNTSHPDWKALVSKVGEQQAWKLWMQNGEEIPPLTDVEFIEGEFRIITDIDRKFLSRGTKWTPEEIKAYEESLKESYELASDLSSIQSELLLPGFTTFTYQQQAINTLSSALLFQMKTNKKSFDRGFEEVKEEIDQVAQTNPKFVPVKDNIVQLKDLVKAKLVGIGLLKQAEDQEDIEDLENPNLNLDYWKDDWVLSFDAKKGALETVKTLLAFVPRTQLNQEGEPVEIKSELSYFDPNTNEEDFYPEYMSYDEVFDQLKGLLAGITNTWDAMRQILVDNEEAKPFITNVLYQIDQHEEIWGEAADKERLVRQFVSIMSSQRANAKTILHDKDKSKYDLKVVDSNQSSLERQLKANWSSSFKRSSIVKTNKFGDNTLDKAKVQSLLDRIKNQANNRTKSIDEAEKILGEIGVEISDGTKKELNKRLDREFTKHGLFTLISKRLQGFDSKEEEDILTDFNPVVNNSGINRLAQDEAKFGKYIFTNTYINGQGNSVQSYIFNNALSLEFNKLKRDTSYVDQLLNTSFGGVIKNNRNKIIYKSWLYELKNNPIFKKTFQISPFDVIRQQASGRKGVKLTQMGEVDLEVTKVGLFQNAGRKVKGANEQEGRIMNYLLTVPSKVMGYVITTPAIQVTIKDGKLSNTVKDALYSVAATEMNRIYSVQSRDNITNATYRKGGKQFYFFPTLNNLPIWAKDQTLLLPTTTVEGKTVEEHIRTEVERVIIEEFVETRNRWKKLGIITEKENKNKEKYDHLTVVDNKYDKSVLRSSNEENRINLAIADYVVNTYLAKFNLHQTAIGDPALFYKSGIKAWEDNVYKRLAGIIAPRKELYLSSTADKFVYVNLKDKSKDNKALNYAQLLRRLSEAGLENEAKAYSEINGTDAQEWVTLKEELAVKYNLGVISTKSYNDILKRYEEQGDNLVLTKEELGIVLGGSKPVYYFTRLSETEDVAYKDYVKSSSIPLIPQFTKGLELDKLRNALEAVETKTGKTVRGTYESAFKIGGKEFLEIFDSDSTIKEGLVIPENSYEEVFREGFGIQQEVPYEEEEGEISKSTQATKLLFDGIEALGEFLYKGERYGAYNLKDIYLDLHKQLYENSLKDLHSEILNPDQTINTQKLQELLLTEGKKRGYTEPELRALRLNETFSEFILPLWSNPTGKFESLLTSLYSNNIVKQTMHGRSYVLVSEEGVQGYSKDIVYTKKYTGKLLPQRIVYRKEKEVIEFEEWDKLTKAQKTEYQEEVAGAQVLIPWTYRDKNGNTIDIKKYLKPDGTLNLSKISPSLLKQFGFRIPNQGHNSMSYIEVVGFLPEVMGDIVVATRNFVVQMGSDFDIDKLYVYQHKTFKTKSGNIRKKKDDIKNDILDIHLSVVSNPAVFNRIVTPLSTGKLKYKNEEGKDDGIAVLAKNYYEKKKPNTLLSYQRDTQKYLQSVDGKAMVGITALTSVFSSMFNQSEEEIQPIVVYRDENQEEVVEVVPIYIGKSNKDGFEGVKLDTISKNTATDGRDKIYIVSSFESAAVDNEKDPICYYVNAVPETSDMLVYLLHLGVQEDYIGALLGQPAVREYVEAKKARNGTIKPEGYKFQSDVEILGNLIDKYKQLVEKEVGKELDGDHLDGLADFPITYEHLVSTFTEETNKPVKWKDIKYSFTPSQIQLLSLLKLSKVKVKGEFLAKFQGTMNIDSKGVGASLLDVADRVDRIQILKRSKSFSNINSITDTTKTTLAFGIDYGLFPANKHLNSSSLYPYNNTIVLGVFKKYEEILGKEVSLDDKKEFWEGIKSYVFSNPSFYEGINPNELRESLFFDRGTNQSLATEIDRLKTSKVYQNNPFLIRLSTDIDKTGKKPSKVYYSASKQETIDTNSTYQGFLELLVNPETHQVMDRAIKYFYLNGGIQEAREWGKLIDPVYLQLTGFSKKLADYSFNDQEHLGKSVIQYLQHNPYKLTQLPQDKATTERLEFEGGSLKTAKIIKLPSDRSSNAIKPLIQGNGYYQLFTVKNSQARKGYSIFRFKNIDLETGQHLYERLPVLGDNFYTEYQYGAEEASSLITKEFKQTPQVKREGIVKDKPIEDTKTVSNQSKEYGVKDMYNNDLAFILNKINSKSKNNNHKLVAKVLLGIENQLSDVKVGVDYQLGGANKIKGRYDRKLKDIKLNPNGMGNPNNVDEWEALILHEGIHAAFDVVFRGKNYKKTPEQEIAFKRFLALQESIRERILNNELPGFKKEELVAFDSLLTKMYVEKQPLTANEKNEISKLRTKYYPFSKAGENDMFEEFLTYTLTEPDFQATLNGIKYDGKRTLLDRILELITKIIAEFSVYTPNGRINIQEESLLNEALKRSLLLFNQQEQKAIIAPNKGANSMFDFNKGLPPNIRELNENFDLAAEAIDKESEVKYNKIINAFKTRVTIINQSIAIAYTEKDYVRAKELESRRDTIKEEIEELIENNTLKTVIEQGENDLKRAEAVLGQEFLSANDIVYLKGVTSVWKNAPELILSQGEIEARSQNYKEVNKLRTLALELDDTIDIIARRSLLDMVKKTSGIKTITEESLNTMEKVNTLSAALLDLSRGENILGKVLDKWTREAAFATNQEVTQIMKTNEELVTKVKDTPEYKKDKFYLFAQEDEDGNLTGELVSPLRDGYYKERDALLKFARDEKDARKRGKKFERYFKWVRDNHIIIDTRRLFKQDQNGGYIYNPNEKYLTELKEEFKGNYTEIIESVKERIEKYNEQLLAKAASVEGIEDGFRELEEWKLAHDPNIYVQNLIEGYTERKSGNKTIINKGYEYAVKRAKDNWVDPKYKAIKANEDLSKYYDFMTKTLRNLYEYLPLSFKEDLTNYTIPNIAKSLLERYNEEGFRSAVAGLREDFIESITVTDLNQKSIKDPITNEIVKTLNVLYTTPIDPQDKSYDLAKVIQVFALQAVAFKYNSQIEDQIKLADSVFKEALELQRRPDGYPKKDRFGEVIKTDSLENLEKQWRYRIEAFYGNRRDKEQYVTRFSTPKKGKERVAQWIEEYRLAVVGGKEFDITTAPKEIEEIVEGINKIEDTNEKVQAISELKSKYVRYYSGSKVGDKILTYVQIKGMGWNPFSALINWGVGMFSNINWAAGNTDFSMNDFFKANGIILSTTHNDKTRKKFDSLLLKFDVLKEINEAAYESSTNTNQLRRGLKKLYPLEMQRMSERFVQGQTFVSMLLHNKVKTLQGEEISLWEAFDEKGNWREDILGKNDQWQVDTTKLAQGTEFYNFKFKLDQILKSIHGNYDPNSPVLIKRGILGRAVMQFRSWVAEGFEQRLGDKKFDLLLQRERKGRYRTLSDLGLKQSLKTLLKLTIQGDKAFEGLRDQEGKLLEGSALAIAKENMRKNLGEAAQLIMLYGLYMLITNMVGGDDDDDEVKWSKNYALNTTLRLIDDTMFWYNPNAFENITRSAIPAATLIGDIYKFGDALFLAAQGEDTIATGVKAGQSRVLWRGAKLFPFSSSIAAVSNKFMAEESYRK